MKYLQIISADKGDLSYRPLVSISNFYSDDIMYNDIDWDEIELLNTTISKYGYEFTMFDLYESYTDFIIREIAESGGSDIKFPIIIDFEDSDDDIVYDLLSEKDLELLKGTNGILTEKTYARLFITNVLFRDIDIYKLVEWDWSLGNYVHNEYNITEDDFYLMLKNCFGDNIQ